MHKTHQGFTIVELLVVIVIISLLMTLSVVGFVRYQIETRDSDRSSKISILTEALEKYYDKNGEYPGCSDITNTDISAVTTMLSDLEAGVLLTPKSASGDTNSIRCTDLVGAPGEADVFAYVGDGSVDCQTGHACLEFTLKYKDETDGTIKSVQSRRRTTVAMSGTPTMTVTGHSVS